MASSGSHPPPPPPPPQPPRPTPPPRPRHSKLLRFIAMSILTLIVVVGIIVLIIWLVVNPKRLVYTLEDGSVHDFNMTKDHLNATFNFTIRSYNPNTKVSVYYDSMEVYVGYDDQTIASNVVKSFFQPHRNVTRLEVNPVAQNVTLLKAVSRDLRLEKSSGEIELNVWIKARIRFKVGVWKSRDRTMRIWCDPVFVHFGSSKKFEKTYCGVQL